MRGALLAVVLIAACGENRLESGVSAGLAPQLAQNAQYAIDDLQKALSHGPACAAFVAEAEQLRALTQPQSIHAGAAELRQRARGAGCLKQGQ